MIPSDPRYLLFLAAVAALFYLLPRGQARIGLLVAAGLGFYATFQPVYLLLLVVVAAAAYAGGRFLAARRSESPRRLAFVVFLALVLAPLLVFKYFDFVASTLARLAGSAGFAFVPPVLGAALPVGISFYTFAAAGYLIDAYVGTAEPERRPLRFLLFVSFFPQLVAGPIARAGRLQPQLDGSARFDDGRAVEGLRQILWGLFLKIVVADRLAPLVDGVYAAPRGASGADLLLATAYFSFQVYADFAGYSAIAIGSARLLGVTLDANFEQPFLARTVPEFWRRWHISLSSWMRDYLFTPLHFVWRRLGRAGLVLALLVTFTVVGLWHGAGLKYVAFGLIHGAAVALSDATLGARDRLWERIGVPLRLVAAARVGLTFAFVTLTFVLFRAGGLTDAFWIYGRVLASPFAGRHLAVAAPAVLIALVVAGDLAARARLRFGALSTSVRWLAYYAAGGALAADVVTKFLAGSAYARKFIYFQF